MKGFKNTKTGPIYVGSFPTGATPKFGDTMPQRFAVGGLVSRTEPSNELDAESGGKTPLRPGYEGGGKVGKLRKGIAALKAKEAANPKPQKNKTLELMQDGKTTLQDDLRNVLREAGIAERKAKRFKINGSKVVDSDNRPGHKAEFHEVDLEGPADVVDKLTKKGYSRGGKAMKRYAEGGKVGALLKAKPAIKAMRDGMAKDVKANKVGDPAGYKNRREAFFESRKAQRLPSSGPATRDTKTGRFAKGGMVGCGFNRKPMIGK